MKTIHNRNIAIFFRCSIKYILLLIILLMFILSVHVISSYGQQQKKDDPDKSKTYSLEDLYAIALQRAEKIRISEEDIFIAEREKDKALSSLLPRLSAFGNYTRYSEEKSSKTSFGSFTIQPETSSSWGFRLDQSISLGGRELRNIQIAENGLVRSKHDLYAVKEVYLFEVSATYFNILKAKKAVEIASVNVERLIKHRNAAQTRLQVGEVTKTALLRADAELSGAQSEVVKAKNNLILAKAVLARLVNIKGEYELTEKAQDISKAENETLESLTQTALSDRAEIKSSRIQSAIAEEQVRYARGSYWPTLSVEGVYLKMDEDPSSPFFNEESIYGVLKLNFPFFEGGLRRAEVREAEARKRQTDLQHDDLKKAITIEVEDAYLNAKTQTGILQSLEDQVSFARENFVMVSKQFEYGLADSIDVMDANTLLVTAERELANARYDYQLAMLKVKWVTGTLLKSVISQKFEER